MGNPHAAANENARRNYQYRVEKRKREHYQKLSIYKAQKNTYKENVDNINQGLGRAYSGAQTKINRVKDEASRRNQDALIKFFKESAHGNLVSGGATGRSIDRMGVLEAGELGRFYARSNSALTDAREDFMTGVKAARRQAAEAQRSEFAKVAFAPTTDVAPPVPVMQKGPSPFMQALSIGSSIAGMGSSFGWWGR